MAIFVTDCPRCNSQKVTFDLLAANNLHGEYEDEYLTCVESFCICRICHQGTIFVLGSVNISKDQGGLADFLIDVVEKMESINGYITIIRHITIKDQLAIVPPDYLPRKIDRVFREGSTCLSVECFNAAGTMFRLCVDLATESLLPEKDINGLNSHIRRTLGKRLEWLFENGKLDRNLEDLSSCIREDGNDGAHDGSLSKADAEDLLDFTYELLERMYTEKKRLELAKERRIDRRNPPS